MRFNSRTPTNNECMWVRGLLLLGACVLPVARCASACGGAGVSRRPTERDIIRTADFVHLGGRCPGGDTLTFPSVDHYQKGVQYHARWFRLGTPSPHVHVVVYAYGAGAALRSSVRRLGVLPHVQVVMSMTSGPHIHAQCDMLLRGTIIHPQIFWISPIFFAELVRVTARVLVSRSNVRSKALRICGCSCNLSIPTRKA